MSSTPPPVVGAPIWPADWSQFVPDTLSALLIGAFVGIALYVWQRRIERSAEERIAVSSWRLARANFAVQMAAEWDPDEGARKLPNVLNQASPLRDAGKSYDVAVWANAAPKSKELQTLAKLLIDLDRLDVAASELYSLLPAATERHGVMNGHTARFVEVECSLILGYSDPTALFSTHIAPFIDIARETVDDDQIAPNAMAFRALHQRVGTSYEELRESIRRD